ncbi:hypothetical protein Nepgr_016106 [Nepenthes gracilis]|uniref:K Homology domain-containing protein n=1 Tax=Nepenthes gracilis TaxID=150966 RepID=A0AAD3XS79_NEPGR|nr:hypothetical protein Nepgr_016106 [Nepenthes gracilis]
MIAVRSLIRLDRAWQLAKANTCTSKRSQGCCSYYVVSCIRKQIGVKDIRSAMEWNRKRRMINTMSRPVGTQSSLDEDVNDETLILGELAESTLNSTSPQDNAEVSEAEGVLAESTYTSVAIKDNDEVKDGKPMLADSTAPSVLPNSVGDGDAEGVSMLSVEKHSVSLEVGSSLMHFIKGKSGSTQRSVEEEMGVKIIFPSSKEEDSIVIKGSSFESIARASEKIQVIIDQAIRSPNLDYSHFISLPLAIHPELVDKLDRFQNSILRGGDLKDVNENSGDDSDEDASNDEDKVEQSEKALDVAVEIKTAGDSDHVKVDLTGVPLISYARKASKSSTPKVSKSNTELGIDRSIFIKPKQFHLTVLMLKLWNKERVHAATEVLQNVASEVIDALEGRPVFVRLKGLDCMKGSLAKARVLYAPVEEIGTEDRLIRACQVIIDAYVKAGLVLERDATHKLKLHATVMNVRHRNRKKWGTKFDSFDARGIFTRYGSKPWGDYHIREAHLSQRFAYDDSGYYHCCASIPFPEDELQD